MSKIKVDSIEGSTGTTVSLPSGQTLDLSSGTVTLPNTSVSNAQLAGSIDLTTKVTGALPTGNLPTIPVAKGGTGLTSLGSAGQVVQVNSGGSALEFAAASSGKTLVKPTRIAFDNSSVTFNQTGTSLQGVFYYPSSVLLDGSFTKTSATSVIGLCVHYMVENNSTNQHDTYCWAGTGATLGTDGDNFRYKVGDDSARAWGSYQYTKLVMYITGMSAASHTFKFACGTYGDRTHGGYYCSDQQHGDRSAGANPSVMWAWEIEA